MDSRSSTTRLDTRPAAIIKLAHSLEMDVVAEGVETASQLTKLKGLMCDEMQGFLLGKPVTADEFTTLLHQQTSRNLIEFKARKART